VPIAAGERLPGVRLTLVRPEGPQTVDSAELFSRGRFVLFAVPGAFTPTCSARHLPGFIDHAARFAELGIELACVAVNDPFVMAAWAQQSGCGEQIRMLADGNGELAAALGLELDASAHGMGRRSQRYAMLIEDGVVRQLWIDPPGTFEASSAEAVIRALETAA